MPGTHHTALYQTDFIRATKRVTASQPTPHRAPPPREKRPKLGLPLWPGAGWTLGTRPGCEGLLCHQPPPRHGGPRVPRPPRSQVTSAEPPPRHVPFPMEAEPTAGPGSPLPIPWAARRGAAGHTDTDRRTERETRQHRAAALARLRGCLAPPHRRPPPAPPGLGAASPGHPTRPRPPSRPRASPRCVQDEAADGAEGNNTR